MNNNNLLLRRPLALALATAVCTLFAPTVFAQNDDAAEEASELDKIVVTGSRIKRAQVEGPAPVTIITREQIDREGFVTVYDALNSMTQVTGATQNELTQNGFTPNANVIDLRGLGPGRTLTLINGRRAADYPLPYNGQSNFVNLGSIPAAAIERIEILAGGASAIYGSDAVAGVINIVLRSNYEGDQATLRVGHPTEGGANTYDFQWAGGKTGSDWSVTYAFEYFDRGAIFASERDFMDSYRDDPSTDNPFPVEGIRYRDRLIGPNDRTWLGGTRDEICARFGSDFEPFNRSGGERCGYYGYPATQVIRNASRDASGYLFGNYDFDNGMQGFFSINYWDSQAEVASATQFWSSPLFFDTNTDSIVDLQRIFTPSEVGGRNAQKTKYDESSYDLSAGLRGSFADAYDWEFTLSRSGYDTKVRRPRFLRQNLEDYFLGPQMGTVSGFPVYQLNVDRYFSPIDPATFNSLSTTVNTDADSSQQTAQFALTGDLFSMPAGPVSFAAVLEAGSQEYDLNADPRIAPGQSVIYNLTGTGGGGQRDRYAMGMEFRLPVFDTLALNLAGRYDKYDDITDVDDAFTWNAGFEYRPFDNLLLRGNYATSFRAPDMHFVFADQSGFFSGVFDEFACRSAGMTVQECGNDATYNYTAFGVRQGNPQLQEEEGDSFTYGIVYDVTDDLSLSVDYYNIELEKVVGDISSAYILRNEADCRLGQDRDGNPVNGNSAFCQFILGSVVRTVGGPDDGDIEQVTRGPINRSYLSNKGIDAQLNYRMDTDSWGNFRYQLAWSHTLDQKFAEFEGEPRESYRDSLQNFDYRSRIRASATWEMGDWQTTLFANRLGSAPNWAETGRIAPFVTYNASVKYRLDENWQLTLIGNNIFNRFHPEDDTFFSYPFFWRAYSPIGREVFVQVDYRF